MTMRPMRASIELYRNCPFYIALYSGDLSQDAIDIMKAFIMLYSTIIALIVKLVFPDGHISVEVFKG